METSGSGSAAAHSATEPGPQAQVAPRSTIGWMEARPSSGLSHFFFIILLFMSECCISENGMRDLKGHSTLKKESVVTQKRLLD